MVKDIMHDPVFLAQKSVTATEEDKCVGQDLMDTLDANKDGCVGMAANMIGVLKRVIVFDDNGRYTLMYNPEIIKFAGPYTADEGCLSLQGTKKTKRYEKIKVNFMDEQFRKRIKTYSGFTAQIIQHEVDHLNGILI